MPPVIEGLSGWDRPGKLQSELERVPVGSSLRFITEQDPRALSERLRRGRAGRFAIETLLIARWMWRVSIVRREPRGPQPSLQERLEECGAFAHLDPRTCGEIAAAATATTAKRGKILVSENQRWPFVGVVIDGVVARTKRSDRRMRILYDVVPSELFGVAEFFDRGLANAEITVLSKSASVVQIPWDIIDRVSSQHSELLASLGTVIAQRLRLTNALTEQSSLPTLGRIAHVLLPFAAPGRGLLPVLESFASITQAQIAAKAGTVTEVAARSIKQLEKGNALRRERGQIRHLDRQCLIDVIGQLS